MKNILSTNIIDFYTQFNLEMLQGYIFFGLKQIALHVKQKITIIRVRKSHSEAGIFSTYHTLRTYRSL